MKSFDTSRNRKSRGKVASAFFLIILVVVVPYNVVQAQIPVGDLFNKAMSNRPKKDTSDKTCRGQYCGRVFISPSEIKISQESIKGDTVVVNIDMANRTDTVITGVLKAYDMVPPQFIPLDSSGQGGGHESKGSSLMAEKGDGSPQVSLNEMSLSTWLAGFPDSVVIPPHSSITLPITVRVPRNLKEGSYSGWLGSISQNVGNRPPPQKPIRMGIISRVKITYDAPKGNANHKGS